MNSVKEVAELNSLKEIAIRIQSGKWIILNVYFPQPDNPVIVMGRIAK